MRAAKARIGLLSAVLAASLALSLQTSGAARMSPGRGTAEIQPPQGGASQGLRSYGGEKSATCTYAPTG